MPGWDFKVNASSRFRNWTLIKICVQLLIWTQTSGPLCLWQCFYCSPITNLVRSTEVSEVTWKLLGVSLFSRLPHSPMQLLLDPLKVHQRLDWLIWKVKHGDSFKILTKLELQNLDITSDSKIGPNFTNWFGLAKFCKIRQKAVARLFERFCDFTY